MNASWGDHIEVLLSSRSTGVIAAETSYEALRPDTAGELTRIVETLTGPALLPELAQAIAQAHDFDLRRRSATVDTGSRSNRRAGGWRSVLSRESGRVMHETLRRAASSPRLRSRW